MDDTTRLHTTSVVVILFTPVSIAPDVIAPVVMALDPLEKVPDDVIAPDVNAPVVMAFDPFVNTPEEVIAPDVNVPVVMALVPLVNVPEEVMFAQEMFPNVDPDEGMLTVP